MTDKMTLQQALTGMRSVSTFGEVFGDRVHEWADAIDAHLAGMGEPVAEVYTMEALVPGGEVKSHVALRHALPAGTKLYTAAPASGDWDAVCQVTANIQLKLERGRDAGRASLTEWANKLTAALPEHAHG